MSKIRASRSDEFSFIRWVEEFHAAIGNAPDATGTP